ncbi:hypothetical protein P3X46_023216 [Hevea brasiliensis]|uniref:Disease resistance RPP13-like protein 1 n=1 Tax=Hevea brasiliensis TaxID=3981 RepID=A0ABQ9LA88_HEVBR|nr:hypothetical protein P3X46_023216 [Hevea brasiliensis]
MAEGLVGGAILSAFLPVLFDRMASKEFLHFFKGRKLNDGLLNRLKTTLNSVNGLLADAEEKQITQAAVKIWLDDLKEAVYEADDLLDEIAYKALQSKLEPASRRRNVKKYLSSHNPFKKEIIEEKLEEVLGSVEFLLKQKDTLRLTEGVGGKLSSLKTPTTSLPDDDQSSIYGRDVDKEAIIKFLLSDSSVNVRINVIPIVGMGGVGKTTLAQLVYNDISVREHFQLRAWVCVSEAFDVFKITEDILKEISSGSHNDKTMNQLQLQLKEGLSGRKYLLVLDDLWNEEYADWRYLLKPLIHGENGSMIIVTTRNERLATMVRTVEIYHLEKLNTEDCWSLFEKHAALDENSSAHPNLKAIGKAIVRRCDGLPLAAKTLGGLLRYERDQYMGFIEWQHSSSLRLSYHHLPSLLKQCFAYCAIFPKDYEFGKEEVVHLWMAEGFLGDEQMEEVGNECFDDLVSRSLFQGSSSRKSHFVMHDLINDLAKFVSGEFCFRFEEGDNSCKIVNRTRHFSFAKSEYGIFNNFPDIYEAKHLRTFIYMEPYEEATPGRRSSIKHEVTHGLLQTLTRLRVLSLPRLNMDGLVDSIRELRQLKYLNLSGTLIESLPESISSLYFLQILILRECKRLVVLPTNMGRLINLSHLDIKGTKLRDMPPQMGKLTKLQKLTDFFVGKQSGSSIKELRKLEELRGELCIRNLQEVEEARDALEANLKGKEKIKKLELTWQRYASTDSENERLVLESLQPHTGLEHLSIHGYGGASFPIWVGHSSFSRMLSLNLNECPCSFLPPLGQLDSLEYLTIEDFDRVEVIGPEFYGSCTSMKKPFRSLKVLKFKYMSRWSEWISCEGAFPLLEELHVEGSANLQKVTLPSHLPSLKILDVGECKQFASALNKAPAILKVSTLDMKLEKLPSGLFSLTSYEFDFEMELKETIGVLPNDLEKIVLINCFSLCLPLKLFTKVKTLQLEGCGNLDSFFTTEANGDFTSLNSLEIKSNYHLVCFPQGGLPASKLTWLSFFDCSSLKKLPQRMRSLLPSLVDLSIERCEALESFPGDGLPSSLSSLCIRSCPKLRSFPGGCLPSKLQSLQISDCNKLIEGCMQWNLQTIPSLTELVIENCQGGESFPGEMLLPSALTCLEICYLPNLKSLDFQGLRHLTSLRELKVRNCQKLMFMPECMHSIVPSLTKLTVYNCPELESFLEGGLPFTLESLEFNDCGKVVDHLMHCDLQVLSSLSHLKIGGCYDPDVESFPGKMLLPSTVTSLIICDLPYLKFLDYRGLQHLTSLEKLWIHSCYNLQSLPDEGLPSSLSTLDISDCPLLKQRCEFGGEDWPKISHIPKVQIMDPE